MIKPANTNHNDINNDGPAMFSVEYSEKGMGDYESYMIVKITDLPVESATMPVCACNAIKLFVGKKGDIVDVYGNSNHPNARFFTDDTVLTGPL
jgi:midasin (ATPase involved in ribosome maturation)